MNRSALSKTDDPVAPGARQAAKAKTRRAILKSAVQLFARQGVEETHAEEIARRAKVGVGTIYLHFGDKNGLLREILLESADGLEQRVQRVYQNLPASPLDLATAHVEALVTYIEEQGRLASLVLSLMISGHPAARAMLDRATQQVEEHMGAGQKLGIYRADINPHLAARAEVHMNLGLLAWWAEDPRRAPRDEIIETLARVRSSGFYVSTKS